MRITEQYFWNLIFSLFFVTLIVMGAIILQDEAYRAYGDLSAIDFILITLATFRLIRLTVYDKVFAFFREQFWNAKELKTKVVLVKPERGPRRTIADMLSCPWCSGVWISAIVIFCYLLTPYAYYPVLLLAIAGVATMLQLTANMIGWKAEQLKKEVERY